MGIEEEIDENLSNTGNNNVYHYSTNLFIWISKTENPR